jgi:serine/threonine-protein kinase
MSPEQAWGRPTDRRSDLFSLGLVLYEMLTDTKPFLTGTDASEMSILEKVRRGEVPPPRSLNPKLPESLDRLAVKMLERDPEARFQDAADLARGLERVARERPPVSTNELKRYMEVLFDRDEREEAIPDDLFPATPRPSRRAETGNGEGAPERAPKPAEPAAPGADLSVDALLKRFGIE